MKYFSVKVGSMEIEKPNRYGKTAGVDVAQNVSWTRCISTMPREPGRMVQQRLERERRAKAFVSAIWGKLDMGLIEQTGVIFPRGGLKRKGSRRLFSFVAEGGYKGRWFTKKCCSKIVSVILARLPFVPPRDPSMEHSAYVEAECNKLMRLASRAKKLSPVPWTDDCRAVLSFTRSQLCRPQV